MNSKFDLPIQVLNDFRALYDSYHEIASISLENDILSFVEKAANPVFYFKINRFRYYEPDEDDEDYDEDDEAEYIYYFEVYPSAEGGTSPTTDYDNFTSIHNRINHWHQQVVEYNKPHPLFDTNITSAIEVNTKPNSVSKTDQLKSLKLNVFICHASEDKYPHVENLHKALEMNGITCWYDKNEIRWGDSIAKRVNEGLRESEYVIVVLSTHSINKNWPKAELESSLNLEFSSGVTRVLPLILGDDKDIQSIINYFPILSSKLFVKYSDGIDKILLLLKERFL